METATSRTLAIDGMSGDVCVQKVTAALKGVQDVSTQSVKVGEATIKADDAGCKAACGAIDRAGYPASEGGRNAGEKTGGSQGAQKAYGHNGGTQVPTQNPAREGIAVAAEGSTGNDRSGGNSPTKPGMNKN